MLESLVVVINVGSRWISQQCFFMGIERHPGVQIRLKAERSETTVGFLGDEFQPPRGRAVEEHD